MFGSLVKLILIVLVIGMTGPSWAHSPNEIGYVIDPSNGTLSVHSTQRGLIDLIKSLKPELNDEIQFNLNKERVTFTEYFNSTIMICLDDKEVELTLKEARLESHDAILLFTYQQETNTFNDISLKISSFTEIYRRTKNIVRLMSVDGSTTFYLDRNVQFIEHKLPSNLP